MKNKIIKTTFALIVLGLCTEIVFAENFNFTSVLTHGTGCPQGSTDVVKTQDEKTVSVLFSEMMAEVPQYDGDNDNTDLTDYHRSPTSNFNSSVSHKVCNITIKGNIPPGEQVDSIEIAVDFRGNTIMDPGTIALFHSQLISWTGPKKVSRRAKDMLARKVWRFGDVDEDWVISNTKKINIESQCSKKSNKEIKFALRNIVKAGIRGGDGESSALVTLDSTDLAGKLSLKIYTKKCHNSSNGGGVNDSSRRVCPRTYTFDTSLGRCVRQNRTSRVSRRRH